MRKTAITAIEMLDYYVRISADIQALKQDLRELTYGEWQQQAKDLANTLSASGIGIGDRVAIMTYNRIEQFILLYATMILGAVYVPINYRLAPQEVAYILKQSEAKIIFSESDDLCANIDAITSETSLNNFIRLDAAAVGGAVNGCWKSLEKLRIDSADAIHPEQNFEPAADTVVYQMYTSGTTGFPKGVMVTQQQLANFVVSTLLIPPRVDAGKPSLIVAPLFHAAALCNGIVTLCMGRPVVILKEFEPLQLVKTLVSEKIAEIMLPPALILATLKSVKNLNEYDFSHLEKIFYGASSITVDVLRRAMDSFQCDFQQGFGMTESVASTIILTVDDHHKALNDRPELLLSCGRAAAFSEVKIVDPETRQELEKTQIGEIAVRSSFLMEGYSKQSDKTAEVYKDGWYYTGDGGYMDKEGYVFVKDRLKDMIVSGGENVYATEVENVLMSHADITDVAVIGLVDEEYGEAVVAVCVRAENSSASDGDMIAYCREHLAGYKIPRRYEYLDELPRNAAGKLLKRELRERFDDVTE